MNKPNYQGTSLKKKMEIGSLMHSWQYNLSDLR